MSRGAMGGLTGGDWVTTGSDDRLSEVFDLEPELGWEDLLDRDLDWDLDLFSGDINISSLKQTMDENSI